MSQECSRRLSYAGLQTEQKSRRVSDAGQFASLPSVSSATSVDDQQQQQSQPLCISTSTMLHDLNSNTSGRYESNKNRPARRISRPTDDTFMCSQQSVLSAMDRFVKAVNNMDSTVLVPSRLQDIEVQNENNLLTRHLSPGLDHVDIYGFFTMLKEVKNELLWGPCGEVRPASSVPVSGRSSPNGGSRLVKQHVRQSSDDSLGSAGFPSDHETDSDLESVVTDRDSVEDATVSSTSTSHLATAFRHHLLGLHTILHELAESADYLSRRYQEEIDASCL